MSTRSSIFDEPDVRALIREIHPDVQAKGTDYTRDNVPERDEVRPTVGASKLSAIPRTIPPRPAGAVASRAAEEPAESERSRTSAGPEPRGKRAAARNLQITGRLLVVRLSAMGDVIHALPAITALRAANPDLQIGWLVEERWAELLCARGADRMAARSPVKPLVDSVHVANFKAWRRALLSEESWREMKRCAAKCVA